MRKYYDKSDLCRMEIDDYKDDILKRDPRIDINDMESDTFIFEDADIYRNGACNLFAEALFIADSSFEVRIMIPDSGLGCHIFCMKNGFYVDVRGATSDFKKFSIGLENKYSSNRSTPYENIDKSEENRNIGIAFAKALIKKDYKRYLLDHEPFCYI